MLGRTHRVGGISAAIITSTYLYTTGYTTINEYPLLVTIVIAGGWLGGLMPDIDHPNSTISRYKVFGIPIFKPIAWLINSLFGHRGATHTLWALILTWAPFLLLPAFIPSQYILTQLVSVLFGIGYAVGYLSHLLLDSLTPSGTPMFWPLPDIHLGKLTTGKYDGIVRVVIKISTLLVCGSMLYFWGTY